MVRKARCSDERSKRRSSYARVYCVEQAEDGVIVESFAADETACEAQELCGVEMLFGDQCEVVGNELTNGLVCLQQDVEQTDRDCPRAVVVLGWCIGQPAGRCVPGPASTAADICCRRLRRPSSARISLIVSADTHAFRLSTSRASRPSVARQRQASGWLRSEIARTVKPTSLCSFAKYALMFWCLVPFAPPRKPLC